VVTVGLLALSLGLLVLASQRLRHKRAAWARRTQQRARIRRQQFQSERHMQQLTHAAFDAMLQAGRQPSSRDVQWRD
jgi:hypothetical protein